MTQVLIDRATLEQLIESLETCSPGDYSTGYVIHPSFDAKAVDAAITALRAALANAEPTGWQPIATAPKDKTVMLFGNVGCHLGRWDQYCQYNHPKFTHWMPLPAAPKDTL